jgi:hypothetical protein
MRRNKMSDFQYDEKPKNDKPKIGESYEPERGGCLTAFLVVLGVANVGLILVSIVSLGGLDAISSSVRGTVQFLLFLQVVMSIAAVACAYGLWNWKDWAYKGLFVIYFVNALIGLFSGQIPVAIGAFVGMGILYYLMKDKSGYLT